MKWERMDTGAQPAEANMMIDRQLLETAAVRTVPVFHTYDWSSPAITYGYFIQPQDWLDVASVHCLGVDLARRPTGGGITLHMGDLAFSVLVPAVHPAYSVCTLDNYGWINACVAEAIRRTFDKDYILNLLQATAETEERHLRQFCMTHPTQYDVILNGKKVGGAAQRRTKHGYLHQGTICLALPCCKLLSKVLHNSDSIMQAMRDSSHPLLGDKAGQQDIVETRARLITHLHHVFLEKEPPFHVRSCVN